MRVTLRPGALRLAATILLLAACAWAQPAGLARAQAQPAQAPAQPRPAPVPARPTDPSPPLTRYPAPGRETAQDPPSIVKALADSLDRFYVFPDRGAAMKKALLRNLKKGDYGKGPAEALADRLTADLRAVCNDKHLNVRHAPEMARALADTSADRAPRDREREMDRAENFGFQKLERLTGNIGYFDLRKFADPDAAGATAVAAMRWLSNSDALIIDLRHNGGGHAGMIQLLSSYLFGAEPVHLNSFYWRDRERTDQSWTLPYVEGVRRPEIPVFVLTSATTFSAAEEFTYNLKNLKRATIIGETTGGGAHPVHFSPLPEGFVVMIPVARAINPITQTNWEGTGIAPDIACPADEALAVAHREALSTLAQRAKDEEERARLTFLAGIVDLRRQAKPADPASLTPYVGDYGVRHVTQEGDALYFQREGGPRLKMIPVGGDRFLLEDRDDIRVSFARDAKGEITEMAGDFADGPGFREPRARESARPR